MAEMAGMAGMAGMVHSPLHHQKESMSSCFPCYCHDDSVKRELVKKFQVRLGLFGFRKDSY